MEDPKTKHRGPAARRRLRPRPLSSTRLHSDQCLCSAIQARDGSTSFRWRQGIAAPTMQDQQPLTRHTHDKGMAARDVRGDMTPLAARGSRRVHGRTKTSSCAQLRAPGRGLCALARMVLLGAPFRGTVQPAARHRSLRGLCLRAQAGCLGRTRRPHLERRAVAACRLARQLL